MCCTIEAGVSLSDTIIYSAEVEKPGDGLVHVLGYQNSVTSFGHGPNAMILPIPALGPLGPENVIDATAFKGILKDYHKAVKALKPRTRRSLGMIKGVMLNDSDSLSYQIIESGSYTIALASSAAGLNSALKEVPESKRPNIRMPFLTVMAKLYPEWPIAICCFDMSTLREAEPIFWWYKPRAGFENTLFAPAVDAHDGSPPRMDQLVRRDHTLIFGSKRAEGIRQGGGIRNDINYSVPKEHQWMFTSGIRGGFVNDGARTKNGDFIMSLSDILDDKKESYVGGNFSVYQPAQ